jgi:PAS domain S-box-containing protein
MMSEVSMGFTEICRALLDAYTEPVFLLPQDDAEPALFIEVNDAAIEKYGYSRQGFMSLGLADITSTSAIVPSADAGGVPSVGGRSIVQSRHRTRTGLEFPVEIGIAPVIFEQIAYRLLTIRDLSVQSKLQGALAANEERFNSAFLASPDIICLSRLNDGTYSEINESFTQILGYQAEEVLGKSATELNIWKRMDDRNEFVRQLGEKGFINNLEAEFVCKDGTVKIGLVSARISESREQKYVFSIVREITQRKKVEDALRYKTLFLEKLTSAAKDGIVQMDHLGLVVFWNPGAESITGYSAEEMVGQGLRPIFAPTGALDVLRRVIDEGTFNAGPLELNARHKDGQLIILELAISTFELSGKMQVMAVIRDVTERKKVEEDMVLMNFAVDHVAEEIHLLNEDSQFVFVNQAACRALGYAREELIGRKIHEVVPQQSAEAAESLIRELNGSGSIKFESCQRRRDGRIYPVEVRGSYLEYGGVTYHLSFVLDISERKKVEEEMKLMSFALDHISEEVHLSDESARFVYANHKACVSLGYSREDLVGMSVPDIDPKRTPEIIREARRRLKEVKTLTRESVQIRKDGTAYPVEVTANYFEYGGGAYNLTLVRDISERKNSQEEMRRMDFALDHISEEVHLSDDLGRLVYVNQKACEALGFSREELLGMKISAIDPSITPEVLAKSRRDLVELKTLTHETVQRRHDGSNYPVEVTGNHFEYAGTSYSLSLVRDITERKRNEEERRQYEKQLLQAQKLESLEVLAGGVAHDFNNLIAAIMGHAELTKRRLPPESPAAPNLRQIEQAAKRAAELAKQMLAYSGKGKFVVETIDLNRLLEESMDMLKVSVSRNIVLQFNPCYSLPGIDADATQIRQIVMNLIINASEAIGDDSGVISISTDCIPCDPGHLKTVWFNEDLPAGDYVSLEVKDSGCGMDDETVSKLFDPFYTTKFTGRGLGMSAVMGIVRGHKGAIRVQSAKGGGTIFKVLLPASGRVLESKKKPVVDENWRGSGTVMLVDDEAAVRRFCAEMLNELGFESLQAADGQEALKVFKGHPEIDLVLLDLTMPNLNGEKCFYELQKLDPQVKVIISSGYSESEVAQKFAGKKIAGFLQKPYRLAALMEVLRGAESSSSIDRKM